MLHGSINHVSVTVRSLDEAMAFFGPLLEFLGYTVGSVLPNESAGTRLTVNINASNGIAFNVWEATPALAGHEFEIYEPGLHHVAFNVSSHADVDRLCELVKGLGGEILDGPAEFPYAEDGLGYYAFYFLGPDRLKFECVHMPGLEKAFRDRGLAWQGAGPLDRAAAPAARIFHLVPAGAWDDSAAAYRGDTLDSEGFIHCSDAQQVLTVANRIFRGEPDLLLLEIDPARVEPEIRYENLEGGHEMFPHVYGALNRAAVLSVHRMVPDASGAFPAPDALARWL